MKTQTALGSAFVVASTLGLLWQDPAPPLKPVPPGPDAVAPPDAVPEEEDVEWSALLAEPDLDARAAGFWRALEALPTNADLRALLEAWSADPAGGELAWTARLLLELDARGAGNADPAPTYRFPHLTPTQPYLKGPTGGWPTPPTPWGAGPSPFDSLFGGDPFQGLFGGEDPFGGSPFLQPGAGATGKSTRIELTPDGVRVHVETTDAEGTSTEVYEAESLEALEREHPELFADGSLRTFGQRPGTGLVPRLPLAPGGGLQPVPPAVRTDVLGIYAVAVPGPGGVAGGLRVQAIEPHSIAAALGLAPGDTVVRIDATPIATRADVATALAARADGAGLEVEWIDAAGTPRTRTWEP